MKIYDQDKTDFNEVFDKMKLINMSVQIFQLELYFQMRHTFLFNVY